MTDVSAEKMVKAYLKMREARGQLKKEFEEKDNILKLKMDRLEAAMLATLNSIGGDSMRTVNGTFYKQENITPQGNDWGAFFNWVKEKDAFDAIERRIKKSFITEYMETHKAVPPGVSVFREWVVRVRRKD